MARYWIGNGTSTDSHDPANWSSTSGGPGGASVPTSLDDVMFDGSATGDCTLTDNLLVRSLTVATDYTGHFAAADYDVTVADGQDATLRGVQVSLGTGTWTVSNGTFDYRDVGTLNPGSSRLVFDGDCQWIGTSKELHAVTIRASATVVVPDASAGEIRVDDALTVDGTLEVTSGKRVRTHGNVSLGSGGRLTGAGDFRSYNNRAGNRFDRADGSQIDIDLFQYRYGNPTAVFAGGLYDCDQFTYINASTTTYTLYLSETTYVHTGGVDVQAQASGDYAIRNDVGNPSLELAGNLTVTQPAAGRVVWTKGSGRITASGSGDRSWDWVGAGPLEPVDIVMSSGTLSLVSTLHCQALNGHTGTLDPGGQDIQTVADFTIFAGFALVGSSLDGANISVGGSLDWSGPDGGLLDLAASASWTLDVTGTATIRRATIANCSAASGQTVTAADCIDGGGNTNVQFIASNPSRPYGIDQGQVQNTGAPSGQVNNSGPEAGQIHA